MNEIDDLLKKNVSEGKLTKRGKVAIAFLIAGIVITILSFVFSTEIYGRETVAEDGVTVEMSGSVFDREISSNSFVQSVYSVWIPALIKSVRVITITVVISMLIVYIMRRFFGKTARGITVGRLVESCIKWIVAIICVLLTLSAWGVNTTALVASAGILTLVIGLGAQSLVADIVAGVFIVFEGEFQVGDIVIVNGWRGTVQEIGMRTTKLVDASGNVNIINNSQIVTVVNQTKNVSLAKCYIGIDYRESIPHVEEVIKANLPAIRAAIPEILDGPFYKGVDKLNSSSVDLLFVANCKEEDIYNVQRAMNRQLKLIFDMNNINIPFPQVVVNAPPAEKPDDAPIVVEEMPEASVAEDKRDADEKDE